MFQEKVLKGEFDKLTNKEIDNYLVDNWLIWTCKFNLSPMGHLTLKGKQKYIDGLQDEIKKIIGTKVKIEDTK